MHYSWPGRAPGFAPWNFVFPVVLALGIALTKRIAEAGFPAAGRACYNARRGGKVSRSSRPAQHRSSPRRPATQKLQLPQRPCHAVHAGVRLLFLSRLYADEAGCVAHAVPGVERGHGGAGRPVADLDGPALGQRRTGRLYAGLRPVADRHLALPELGSAPGTTQAENLPSTDQPAIMRPTTQK